MKTAPNILIVDSGVGGLSVAKEIFALHPHLNLTCIADNAAYPYGNREDNALTNHLIQLMGRAITALKPDLIVIACNTASTLALDRLRHTYNIPFIGVVPAIKPAAKLSKTGAIGLLATPATVQRPYTHGLIHDHAEGLEVQLHGSLALVHIAEKLTKGTPPKPQELVNEIEPLLVKSTKAIDTIVLACTHFPLLKPYLRDLKELSGIQWIDSGAAIANRVGYWLETLALAQAGPKNEKFSLLFTQNTNSDASTGLIFRNYINHHILNHSLVDVDIEFETF